MKSVFFAIVYTEGQMTKHEILAECAGDRFCPLLTYEKDGIRWLPITRDANVAMDIAKRNIPKDQIWGIMEFRFQELALAEDQGLQPEILEWPKRFSDYAPAAFPLALPVAPQIKVS